MKTTEQLNLKFKNLIYCNYQIIEVTFTFKECKTSAAGMKVKIQFLKYFIFKQPNVFFRNENSVGRFNRRLRVKRGFMSWRKNLSILSKCVT